MILGDPSRGKLNGLEPVKFDNFEPSLPHTFDSNIDVRIGETLFLSFLSSVLGKANLLERHTWSNVLFFEEPRSNIVVHDE